MERSAPTPTAFRRASWPVGSSTGGAPIAAAERLCCWIASHYIRAIARACIYVVLECAPTRRVHSNSPSLAGRLGGGGERGSGAARLGSCSGGGLAGRTAAAARSGRFCLRPQEFSGMLPTMSARSQKKKAGMQRSSPTLTAFRRAGWHGGSDKGGAPTAAIWPSW